MSDYTLFLDDERDPADRLVASGVNIIVCRNYDEAVNAVDKFGMPSHVCLDHDLGPDSKTGHEFAHWLVDYAVQQEPPAAIQYSVHSQNPVGAANIKGVIDGYIKFINKGEHE